MAAKIRFWHIAMIVLVFTAMSVSSCGPGKPAVPTVDVKTIVHATLSAMTAQASTPLPTSLPTQTLPVMGSISGSLSYPSDHIPSMRIEAIFLNADGSDSVMKYQLETQVGQATYQVDGLPAGAYHVYATVDGPTSSIKGAYTQAVLCGLIVACTDHTPIAVTVVAGQVKANANITDWYAPSTAAPSPTAKPTGIGSIVGTIYGYPYGAIPALRIVAFYQGTPWHWWEWRTGMGNTYFEMNSYIDAGTYQVVAYDLAGHTGGCTHLVTVLNGQSVTCDITDWSSSWPAQP
jgi:hypothetical protein